MKRVFATKRTLLGIVVCLMVATTALYAQSDRALAGQSLDFHVSSLHGYAVSGSAHGSAGLDYSAGASVTQPPGHVILHRIILDRSHNLYFGYDLEVFPAQDNTVRLHFAPLSDLSGFRADFATFRSAPMDVPADRTVELDTPTLVPLEINAAGVTTLTDTLTFRPAA